MTVITCPSCQAALDEMFAEARFCPACGFPLETESGAEFVRNGVNLRMVARVQRRIIWFVLLLLGLQLLLMLHGGVTSLRGGGVLALVNLAATLAILANVLMLMSALRDALLVRMLTGLFLLVACVNVLILLIVNQEASVALRKAGLKIGLLGVSDEAVRRVLSRLSCHICGYNLTGNLSGRCPECGTMKPPSRRAPDSRSEPDARPSTA